ncbi:MULTISPECIES: VWA domain-containing protein [unclassified Cryobacterium]|uniref:vWA domain-containing protein n=1 Tax=unclassified Cryobacterium TaxID=2649013 RepID=UPI001069B924|nr:MULTISPECIES: VWA domain-containing protein [unclassified Cryobacterium]TFB96273.1 VWA domain-containing protein [Cryobacterium sp. MDB2-A-1]TFC12558.1 VWA domain-containing protein [Cryobacterium sp. MDB2-A-2]
MSESVIVEDAPLIKKPALLPCYIVVDTSSSMRDGPAGKRLIDIANEIIPAIVDEIERTPTVRDKIRLCLIEFASEARTVVPLGDKQDFIPTPVLQANGATNYTKVFQLLRHELDLGYQSLKSDDVDVYRPLVFFVTDGEPNDNDEAARDAAFNDLIDDNFVAHPTIVAFGVAEASATTLDRYVTKKHGALIVAKSGVDAGAALAAIIKPLVSTIIGTAVGKSGDDEGDEEITIDLDGIDSDLFDVKVYD